MTLDGGPPVDLRRDRFATCSPQRSVQLPPGNILEVPPQLVTFTACGWVAWLVGLPVGRHTPVSVATGEDDNLPHTWAPTIDVVPTRP